jgi:hypothetical protein
VENDIFPEAKPYETLPIVEPVYEKVGECQVRLKDIRIIATGFIISNEDIMPSEKGNKNNVQQS